MQMQIWQFPISLTKWEENREPQLLLAATSDHENEDNAGGRGKGLQGLGF